jgi:DNA-binding NarL/FixJ family response regulator
MLGSDCRLVLDVGFGHPLGVADGFEVPFRGGRYFVLTRPTNPAPALASLSEAERAVARAVAEGLGNAEIARARGVSTRTVANQVASIFRKLGVKSRLELVAVLGA